MSYFFWTPGEFASATPEAAPLAKELTYKLTEEGTKLWMSYPLHREWLTKVAIEEYSNLYGPARVFSIVDYQDNILTVCKTKQISNGP